jgi:ubiquinone/menaquinone biosynthesis C-methylase UbiE
MVWSTWMRVAVVGGGVAVVGLAVVAWRFFPHWAPFAWTDESGRLARALAVQPGMRVADIGAGAGAHAEAMARIVGPAGRVIATEIAPEQRATIERRARAAGRGNLDVIAGSARRTELADACCDAIYMRGVFHHLEDPAGFAADVARALGPGGRVGVIDFAPGDLWFHGRDHGVRPETVSGAFEAAGLRLLTRDDTWGGGLYLLVFEDGRSR